MTRTDCLLLSCKNTSGLIHVSRERTRAGLFLIRTQFLKVTGHLSMTDRAVCHLHRKHVQVPPLLDRPVTDSPIKHLKCACLVFHSVIKAIFILEVAEDGLGLQG